MAALRRIARLLVRPAAEWDAIAAERTTIGTLLARYVLPLALLAPAATVIGMSTFDRAWDPAHGYLVPPDRILATAATTCVAIVGSILALAAVFTAVVPMYGGRRDYVAALAVATYGAVPVLVAGATLVLPVMAIVGVVGLCHSCYLTWLGARRVLGVPEASATEFIGISAVLFTLVSAVAGAIAGAAGFL